MDRYNAISLIEPDTRQRAEQSKSLNGGRFHIEPYENVREFIEQGNVDTLVLMRDEDNQVDRILSDMRMRNYWSPTLVHTNSFDPVRCSQLMLQGVVGVLPSPINRSNLERFLAESSSQITALIDQRYGAADARQKLQTLTKRELDVLTQLQHGLSNREIGEKLSISPRTVEVHRGNMLRKLGASTALAAIRVSVEANLLGG
ncbi:FixJ family two-component response regulator [Novosphingobium chloroacetimidivorans]|uniref:FixJ family two-component response regulator n=1 Tax=Novosphingobium chloroacetimidivorans TaxID=1428314 RepID=A0A7W7KE10_9SPHN|nr:LuxR family transcriptional regulator [Novosphingobium chloroacetimidivorans]MBB4861116.1 FixJ family two-component response regulator [Novosphingobium chloroacetimidivorans]